MSTDESVATIDSSSQNPEKQPEKPPQASALEGPPPSYVKLAMRNMVKKGGKSLYHFLLSSVALLTLLIGLAYLTR
jgi:hypothetical protein